MNEPINQTIEAFVNDLVAKAWRRLDAWDGDEKARIEPFKEIELNLSVLWVRA